MLTPLPRIVLALLIPCYTLTALAQDAPPAPGTYEGDGLTLTLTAADDGKLTGSVTLGDKKFPVTAAAEGATIRGTFDADGTAYPFVLKADAAGATFDSDGNTYKLKRRASNPLAKPKKPNPLAGGPRPPEPPAPAALPADSLVGTFSDGDGMSVTIAGGAGGVYDAVVSDDGHKTAFKLTSAGEKGYTGVMEEEGEKIAVTATLGEGGVLKVSADGETMTFRRQDQPNPGAPPGPPPGAPPSPKLPDDFNNTTPAPPPAEPPPPPADAPMPPRPGNVDEPPRAAAAAGKGGGVLLKPQFVGDPMLGTDAMQLLVPDGWRLTGGVGWRQHPQFPAYPDFAVTSADGSTAVTYFPDDPGIWFPDGDAMFPPGSTYLGNRVAPPAAPGDYVRTRFAPLRRGAKFADPVDLPRVAAVYFEAYGKAAGIQSEIRAAKVRLSYSAADGRPAEEDVYCVISYDSFAVAGKPMVAWNPLALYSFRAPAGQLEARTPMMQTVASSLKHELKWVNKYAQLKEVLQQQGLDAIAEAGKRSKIISQLNDDILKIRREVYENEQKAFQKANDAWCEYIGGMSTTYNPRTGTSVSAPNGAAVFQQGGNYYYTFDPNDPNVAGMQRVGG
jgi:hypothetical protein